MAEELNNTQAPATEATAPAAAAPTARPERPARPFGKRRFESRRKVCKLCAERWTTLTIKTSNS